MIGNVPRSSNASFDVSDESQVATLLKHVRRSTLDPQSKDDIRDVIFDLRKGFDEALLAELQLYVEPLQVTVTYGASIQTEIPAIETEELAPTEPVPLAPVSIVPPVSRSAATSSFGRQRPVPPVVSRAMAAPAAAEPQSVVPPPAVPLPPEEPAVPTQAPVATEPSPTPETDIPPSTPVTDTSSRSVEAAQQRIDVIKRTVNAAVGNPVNLIDANNTVGREYMNALLAAMKSVANGGLGLSETMERLERAFAAVEGVLQVTGTSTAAAAHVTDQPVLEVGAEQTPAEQAEGPAGGYAVAAPDPSTPSVAAPEPEAPIRSGPEAFDPALPVTPTTGVRSVAAMGSTWQQQAAASAPAPAPTPTVTDPYRNPTIDAGLAQLLSEWKLFKSSGLFGTGPSGIDHPLYQAMRNLKMNQVITGRFEGATPEVKQSITDYMNGWRYEQGMTHDMQETFEQYLRRVIKSIIDKRTNAGS